MDEQLLRSLVREHLMLELIQSKNPKSLASAVVNFLRTKYGSALASMAPAVFAATLATAAEDIMRSKGVDDEGNVKNQIVTLAKTELAKTGDAPGRRKPKPRPAAPEDPKKKPGMLGRLFGRG